MENLSETALALFRRHVEQKGQVIVDETTREPYRELERAGLMRAGSTFRDGEESIYRLTRAGFDLKSVVAPALRIRLASSLMGNAVFGVGEVS